MEMSKDSERIPVGNFITIYRRGKKQQFTADFWYGGQHRRQSLKTANLKIARQRAIELEGTLLSGGFKSKAKSVAIDVAIDSYLDFHRTERRRPKTLKKYSSFLKTFAQFAREHAVTKLDEVRVPLIDKFRAIRKPTHSAKSMHNEAVMLNGLFRWCNSREMTACNPMAGMNFKRPPLVPRGGPSIEEINQILAAAPARLHIMLAVLAFTGMRSGELQRLTCNDLDLDGNWLHIVSREGGETKTGQSRKIPIHEQLRNLLATMPKRGDGWLFTASASKKYPSGDHFISTKHLNEDFLAILKRVGLRHGRDGGFTIHSLRHSFKAICVNARVPERAVDIWMGHSTGNSVRAAYYLLSDEESQRFMSEVPFGTGQPAAFAGD
jgi:integrase